MEDVAEEMPIIDLPLDLLRQMGRQLLEPVSVVSPKGDIEGHDLRDFIPVDFVKADRRARHGEAMERGLAGFHRTAFEIATAVRIELPFKIIPYLSGSRRIDR